MELATSEAAIRVTAFAISLVLLALIEAVVSRRGCATGSAEEDQHA